MERGGVQNAEIWVAGHKSAEAESPERFPLLQLYITVISLSFHSVWALSGGVDSVNK